MTQDNETMLRSARIKIQRYPSIKYSILISGTLLVIGIYKLFAGVKETQTWLNLSPPCPNISDPQFSELAQDDVCLVQTVKKYIYYPNENTTVNLDRLDLKYYAQFGQDKYVDEIFRGKQNGFFVEVGAGDGEKLSNTLYLEKERRWTGLLIEADPDLAVELLKKHRRSYVVKNCVSITGQASKMEFQQVAIPSLGGLVNGFPPQHAEYLKDANLLKSRVTLQCFPLGSLLLALNRTHVDYLSLDIEGPELEILQQFPWDLITVDVVTVEFRVIRPDNGHMSVDHEASAAKFSLIKEFMLGTGEYRLVGTLPIDEDPYKAYEAVFIRNG